MLNDSGCKTSINKETKDIWTSQHSFLLSYSSAQLTVDIGVRQSSNAEPLENCIVFIPIHSSNKKTFNHSHKTEVLKLLRYITKMKFQTSCLFRLKIECKFFRRALEKEDAQPTRPLLRIQVQLAAPEASYAAMTAHHTAVATRAPHERPAEPCQQEPDYNPSRKCKLE